MVINFHIVNLPFSPDGVDALSPSNHLPPHTHTLAHTYTPYLFFQNVQLTIALFLFLIRIEQQMANTLQIATHTHSFKLTPQEKVTETYQNTTHFLRETIPCQNLAHIVKCDYIMTNWTHFITEMGDSLN